MDANSLFLLAASILSIGFISNLVFKRTNVPDLVWLMVLGLIIGPVFRILSRSLFVTAMPYLSALALLIILFDAGININIYKLIREVPRGSLMTFSGFFLSMGSVAALSSFFLGFTPIIAVLLGSVVGGVSSAIVIPIISNLNFFSEDSALLLEIESVITDPMSIIVALAILNLISAGSASVDGFFTAVQSIISSFSISIVLGFFAGTFWLALLDYLRTKDYYYMMTLGFLLFVYPLVEYMGGNGAISVFVVGVVLGNGRRFGSMLKLDYLSSGLAARAKSFQSELSFFIKSIFFVFLGALITFGEVVYFLYGAGFAIAILACKYFAVNLSTYKDNVTKKEKRVMYFMIPRGLAAAVLVSIISIENIPGTQYFPPLVFSVILSTAFLSTLGVSLVSNEPISHKADDEPPVEE